MWSPAASGRAGDGHPQLGFGHRADHEVPVLQRAHQLGNGGAPVREIPAHRDHHQRGRLLPRAGRGRGGRAQRRDERLPGRLPAQVRVQREDLLELVHDQHQPRRAVTGRRCPFIAAGCGGQHRGPDGQVRLIRVPGQPLPDRQRVRAAKSGQPGGQLSQRILGRRHHDTRPPVRPRHLLAPGQDRQQPGPQQRGLPRPRRPGDHHHPAAGRPGGQFRRQLGGQPLPPVEHVRIGLAERQQPPVRAAAHRPRDLLACAGRAAVPGRQHVLGRGLAPGRRDEQLPGRPGQAQRIGQQPGGVLAGGAVDAPLQGADRPRAQAAPLRPAPPGSASPRSAAAAAARRNSAQPVPSPPQRPPSGKPRPRKPSQGYARPAAPSRTAQLSGKSCECADMLPASCLLAALCLVM